MATGVGLEKILDGLAAMLVLVLASACLPMPAWFHRPSLAAGVVFLGSLAVMVGIQWQSDRATRAILAMRSRPGRAGPGSRIAAAIEQIVSGLEALDSPRRMLPLALLTVGIWSGEAVFVMGMGAPWICPWA